LVDLTIIVVAPVDYMYHCRTDW